MSAKEKLARLQELFREGVISLLPQHRAECDLNYRAFYLASRHCNCGTIEKYREAQELAGQKEDYELHG